MQIKNQSVILLVGGKGTRLSNIQRKEKQCPKALQKINSSVLIAYSMSNFLKYRSLMSGQKRCSIPLPG